MYMSHDTEVIDAMRVARVAAMRQHTHTHTPAAIDAMRTPSICRKRSVAPRLYSL